MPRYLHMQWTPVGSVEYIGPGMIQLADEWRLQRVEDCIIILLLQHFLSGPPRRRQVKNVFISHRIDKWNQISCCWWSFNGPSSATIKLI